MTRSPVVAKTVERYLRPSDLTIVLPTTEEFTYKIMSAKSNHSASLRLRIINYNNPLLTYLITSVANDRPLSQQWQYIRIKVRPIF